MLPDEAVQGPREARLGGFKEGAFVAILAGAAFACGFKKIRVRLVFDVKHDSRHRAAIVQGLLPEAT